MPSRRATEPHLLHFDLAAAEAPYTLHVAQREFALNPHTRATGDDARAENGFLRLLADDAVSHYVQLGLPADAVALMWVTQPVEMDGHTTDRIVSMGIHLPREMRLRDVRGDLLHSADDAAELHPKLAFRKLEKSLLHGQLAGLRSIPDQIADGLDP
jgi:hypothetical protein